MRQGQHNKNRSRGRNNQQQRRTGNSANRVYESNGPDVKVRGTAQTVADKYMQLARDAVSSGDTVMSESYFQHAEHYMRVIAATQGYNQQQQQQRMQEAAAAIEDTSPANSVPGSGPQPVAVEQTGNSEPRTENPKANADTNSNANSNANTETGNQPAQPDQSAKSPDSNPASFEGDLPQFLKAPAADETAPEKPKRTRRAPARSRTPKPAQEPAADDAAPAAAADAPPDAASDTEAAVS